MLYLADTNILMRRVQPGSVQRPIVRKALQTLIARGDEVCITAQNLHEFWYVATRPTTKNGLGMAPAQASRVLQGLKNAFRFLPDTPGVYGEWEQLVTTLAIQDARSYDARLVAVMKVYGISHILTFNGRDFQGFPGITVVDPNSL